MCRARAYHSHWGKHHRRHHAKKWWKQRMANAWGYPPVNVEELDDRYEITLFAAGYAKDDFKIALKDNNLSISVEAKEHEEQEFHWRRNEFKPGGFERHFRLNEKIDKSEIGAKYEEGILKVVLPKKSGFETLRQDIEID